MSVFFLQFILFSFSFTVSAFLVKGTFSSGSDLLPAGVCLLGTWLLSSLSTQKYTLKYYQSKLRYIIAAIIHSGVVMIFLAVVSVVFILNHSAYKSVIWYTLITYLLGEILIFSAIIKINTKRKNAFSVDTGSIKKYAQDNLQVVIDCKNADVSELSAKSQSLITEQNIKELFKRSDSSLRGIKILVCDGQKPLTKINGTYDLIFFDQRINDFVDINAELDEIYAKLNDGGVLVAPYLDLETFESNYLSNGPMAFKFFRKMFYYSYYRALPKIPCIKWFYKITSGGKNKVVSKAEVWGRLYYCGFDVIEESLNGHLTVLMAQKLFTKSENPDPSFSPVIMLNRVSIGGHIVKIHKIRSMYPYSEFLQKKVFEMSSLSSTGKFNNDFRITVFGKLFRKYWIDELPQIIDWLNGEIKLVGIRAMSQHYFSLYSNEYQALYFQVKPGIFSPIFDEKTASFDDIQRIEQEYLEKYLKHPFRTDIEYFFKTVSHILKGVRSK